MTIVTRLVVLLSLLWVEGVWAVDCTQNSISLNSQASIDLFQETYGPCDTADSIQIYDFADGVTDITDIDSLSGLKIIGSFSASHTPLLENLDGLANVKKLGKLNLSSGLDSLISISGVSQLGHLGSLTISNNTSLTVLPSFNALRVSGTISIVSTNLRNMHGLHRLARLENFISVWGCCHNPLINLQNNPFLTDCSALAPLLGWPETTHSEGKDWVDEVSYINGSNVLISNNGTGASNPSDCLNGYPEYLVSDSDGDGVINEDDAFPLDPAAAVDSDDDGFPDNWLAGKTSTDSTTMPPLSLDSDDDGDFLDDMSEADAGTDPLNPDTDGDTVFDGIDTFPTDISEWVDTDGDGVGDFADEDDDNDGIPDQNDASPYLVSEVPCNQFDIHLVGQSAIDSFQEDYGPCNVINGSLDVWGDSGSGNTSELVRSQDIENLDGLSEISRVGGWVKLNRLDDLANIAGLISLRTAPRGFTLQSTKRVRNLQGLNNLATPNLSVSDNSSLRSLSGLSSVPTTFGQLSIHSNPTLETLEGVENISNIGTLFIRSNQALIDISALSALHSTFEGITITSNARLEDCGSLRAVLGWPAFPYNPSTSNVLGPLDISNNGYNASSPNHCLTGYNSGDNDEDGVPNETDAFPEDPDEALDSDVDGVGDNADQCPGTSSLYSAHANGCSGDQLDSDGDGFSDFFDRFPTDPTEQHDSDSDGVGDKSDVCPLNDSVQAANTNSSQPVICGKDEDLDGLIDDAEIVERFTIFGRGRYRLLAMSDDGRRIAALNWEASKDGFSILVFSQGAEGAWTDVELVFESNNESVGNVRIDFDDKIETAVFSVTDYYGAVSSASVIAYQEGAWVQHLDLTEEPIGGVNCGSVIGISVTGSTIAFACGLDGSVKIISSTPDGWVAKGAPVSVSPFRSSPGSYLAVSKLGDTIALAGSEDSVSKITTLHWDEAQWNGRYLSASYIGQPQFVGDLLVVNTSFDEIPQAGAISFLQQTADSWSPYGDVIKGLEYEELTTSTLAASGGAEVLVNLQNLLLTMGIRVLKDGEWHHVNPISRTWDLRDVSDPQWAIRKNSLWSLGSGDPVISHSGRLFALATGPYGNPNGNYIRIFEILGDIRPNDTDNDGFSNATDPDDDNDGISDDRDTYPLVAISNLTDTDGDGAPDDCAELMPSPCDGTAMVSDEDDDNDGYSDADELTNQQSDPLDANSLPSDTDGDFVSDANDDFPVDPNLTIDSDRDAVDDSEDNCPLTANASQIDTDLDGYGDACDEDADGDGLTNSEETGLGTNPLEVDTDHDTWSDLIEFEEGSNPLSSQSVPKRVCANGNYYLSTQDAVDALSRENCTYIEGHLWVLGDDINDLSALSKIFSVKDLTVASTRYLTNVDFLRGLVEVQGNLTLVSNYALSQINGLAGVQTVGGTLYVEGAGVLANIHGLSGIKSIGDKLALELLAVTNLDALAGLTSARVVHLFANEITNVDGLSNLKNVESISLVFNENLENLDGFSHIKGQLSSLVVSYTKNLTDLQAFSGIEGHINTLTLIENQSLVSLSGLDGVVSAGSMNVTDNQTLENLDGLAGLISVTGAIDVSRNASLRDISGLSGIESVGLDITMNGNPFLSDCTAIAPLLGLPVVPHDSEKDFIGGVVNIGPDNAEGAQSPDDCLKAYDSDYDGYPDYIDAFPNDSMESADADNDGIGNNADTDDDNDGVADSDDVFPFDPQEWSDSNGDGIGDNYEQERALLTTIYSSLGGEGWLSNYGWKNTSDHCEWYGVICTGRLVRGLSLGSNNLSGEIPQDIGSFLAIEWIQLQKNRITGSIPDSLSKLGSIQSLLLYDNQLYGSLPQDIGQARNLQAIFVHNNLLEGVIPSSIRELKKLKSLLLYHNNLSGKVLELIDGMPELSSIWISDNQFDGEIPSEVGSWPEIQFIYIDNNQFTGSLPDSITQLGKLKRMLLADNKFGGVIPESTGAFISELEEYSLTGNSFHCPYPSALFDYFADEAETCEAARPSRATVSRVAPEDEGLTVYATVSDGGLPILEFRAECTDGVDVFTAISATSQILVQGLSNDKTYSCRVQAKNSMGLSDWSEGSEEYMPEEMTPGLNLILINAALCAREDSRC